MNEARVREKLSRAAHDLASGTGSIQQRLADAAQHFCALSVDRDVPEWMREDWSELDAELTRIPDGDTGSIRATCRTLSDEDASRYAREIISMYGNLCRHNGEEQGLRRAQKELDSAQQFDEID